MSSPTVVKRVRFTPEVKDGDDFDIRSTSSYSPRVLPKTPRHAQNLFPPSPPLSDASSLGDEQQQFIHCLLLPKTVVLDVRATVATASYNGRPVYSEFTTLATHPALRRMTLVSPDLPWPIVVENPNGVSIGDVLFRVHESLSRIASKEEFESVDATKQAEVLRAYQRNYSLPSTARGFPPRRREDGVKRVDWLGKKTLFAGIRKDERTVAVGPETFILDFVAPPS